LKSPVTVFLYFIFLTFLLSSVAFTQTQWKVFNEINSPIQTGFMGVKCDGIGNVWINTENGFYKYDGIFWKNYNISNSGIPYNYNRFFIDSTNNLWFRVNVAPYPYFIKFDGTVWEEVDTNQNCYTENFYFVVDGYGTKWMRDELSSYEAIIRRYDGVNCIEYDYWDIGISCMYLITMKMDHNDFMWFIGERGPGSEQGGIARFSLVGWITRVKVGIPFIGLAFDSMNDKVWTTDPQNSTLCKLGYHDLQTDTSYSFYDPGISGYRYGVHLNVDLNENLWLEGIAGNVNLGLLCFNTSIEQWVLYDENNSLLPANEIYSIAIDINNNKWISTATGLAAFNEAGLILPTQLTAKDTLNFEALVDSIVTESLVVYNTIGEDIQIDSIYISLPEFSAIISLPATIPVGDSLIIFIYFHPELVEEYTGKLTLFTNKGMYIHVLSGNGVLTVDSSNQEPIAMDYYLFQNYPNPFNPATTINYQILERGIVTLKVYDVLGNEVATLVNEEKSTGSYLVKFDASNLSSSIYYYRLSVGEFTDTKKLILLK